MSVVNRREVKIILHRSGPTDFWMRLFRDFAGNHRQCGLRMKYLAMLALRENADWPLEEIGLVFNHPKGHVSRCLQRVKQWIREEVQMESADDPDAVLDEEDFNDTE